MPRHRKTFSPEVSSRRSRQVREQTVGTHVVRGAQQRRRDATYAEGIARKARGRRIVAAVAAVLVALGLAVGAGMLAFRGVLGSELSLRGSDASDSLVAVKSGEPQFVLVSVELGSVADVLDNGGPDMFLLARLDEQLHTLALINVPSNLQITVDNKSESLSLIAESSDSAAIDALSTFAKSDISHFVKMGEEDVVGMVDALGGIELDIDQVIDDPHAGSVYLEPGMQTLDGRAALVYLRATNVALGSEDQMNHQLELASKIIEKLFSGEGGFATRLESVSPFFQTDLTLDDLESIDSWLGGVKTGDIIAENLPGYVTEATDVSGAGSGKFVGSASDLAEILDAVGEGREIKRSDTDDVTSVNPASFSVEVQNGTVIDGAAGVTANSLTSKGFNVSDVGNAEQAVYEETLVIYKGDDGLARAKTVIDAIGIGRAVSAGAYYSFDSDVLLIIGSDYKPTS